MLDNATVAAVTGPLTTKSAALSSVKPPAAVKRARVPIWLRPVSDALPATPVSAAALMAPAPLSTMSAPERRSSVKPLRSKAPVMLIRPPVALPMTRVSAENGIPPPPRVMPWPAVYSARLTVPPGAISWPPGPKTRLAVVSAMLCPGFPLDPAVTDPATVRLLASVREKLPLVVKPASVEMALPWLSAALAAVPLRVAAEIVPAG